MSTTKTTCSHDAESFKETGEPLFSSHMIDLSEEDKDYNIATTKKYLQRSKMGGMPRKPSHRATKVEMC